MTKPPKDTVTPSTYFAIAERATEAQLQEEIRLIINTPIMEGMIRAAGALFAVLNERRQVLAVNAKLLEMMGVQHPETLLGMRPGEIFCCVHAQEEPNGCGTTQYCATCGAAIAMVASLTLDTPVERLCALSVEHHGVEEDMCLSVRSCPITLEGKRFLLLFMQDVSKYQETVALEQVLLHDMNNLITGLLGSTELLIDAEEPERTMLVRGIHRMAHRMAQEIAVQRVISHSRFSELKLQQTRVTLREIIQDVQELFLNHPVAQDRRFAITQAIPDESIMVDVVLLRHVLVNMLKNAFEASAIGEEVQFWTELHANGVCFFVWNRQAIPPNITRRLFQRHFTTKSGPGRGLGAYSMRLLGEELMGGKISFTSSKAGGTIFSFFLPIGGSMEQDA